MNNEKMEETAQRLLKEHQVHRLPVDLNKLAKKCKIKVIYSNPNLDSLSGALIRGNETRILINSSHPSGRKRFTLAHELAHYFLHESQETFVDDENNKILLRSNGIHSDIEREANHFAASLLMPITLLQGEVKKLEQAGEKIESSIAKLSSLFEVSEKAMNFRLLNLGYFL